MRNNIKDTLRKFAFHSRYGALGSYGDVRTAITHKRELINQRTQDMSNRLPELGDECRDKITGFVGIVQAHAVHLAGCDRLYLLPQVDKDNKYAEGMWIDIDMLEIVRPNVLEPVKYTRTTPGGIDLPRSR